jgi:hypothetical protein
VSLESIGKADAFNSKSERLTLSTSSQHGAPACGPEKHISPASFRRVDMKTLVELERGIFNFLEFDITRSSPVQVFDSAMDVICNQPSLQIKLAFLSFDFQHFC